MTLFMFVSSLIKFMALVIEQGILECHHFTLNHEEASFFFILESFFFIWDYKIVALHGAIHLLLLFLPLNSIPTFL